MIKRKDSSNQEVSEVKRGEHWEGSTETMDAEPLENEKEKKKKDCISLSRDHEWLFTKQF